MSPSIDYQAATRASAEAISAAKDGGSSPAEVSRLLADERAKAAEFAAAVPETAEEAAHKLRHAAAEISRGAFEDAETLAAEADAIAETLAARRWDALLAARLRELLRWCEYGRLAFYCNHGAVSDTRALEHIRTTLAGLARPRLAAA